MNPLDRKIVTTIDNVKDIEDDVYELITKSRDRDNLSQYLTWRQTLINIQNGLFSMSLLLKESEEV